MKTSRCALISDRKRKQTPRKKAGNDLGRDWGDGAAGSVLATEKPGRGSEGFYQRDRSPAVSAIADT